MLLLPRDWSIWVYSSIFQNATIGPYLIVAFLKCYYRFFFFFLIGYSGILKSSYRLQTYSGTFLVGLLRLIGPFDFYFLFIYFPVWACNACQVLLLALVRLGPIAVFEKRHYRYFQTLLCPVFKSITIDPLKHGYTSTCLHDCLGRIPIAVFLKNAAIVYLLPATNPRF